jgi:hypothetical protein
MFKNIKNNWDKELFFYIFEYMFNIKDKDMQLLFFYKTGNLTLPAMVIVFLAIFSGCNDLAKQEYNRDISFNTPFPKRNKNLHWKLGDRFTILMDGDTLTYHVSFNPDNRYNYIIDNSSDDTIFAGTVSKHKGLYFFNHRINDSSYWISGVDIDKSMFRGHNTIAGLGTAHFQMQMLYDSIQEGDYHDIIIYFDTVQKKIKLRPEIDILYSFYSSIIGQLARDTLIDLPVRKKSE